MPRYGRTGRRSVNPAGNGLVILIVFIVFGVLAYIGLKTAHSNDPDQVAARQSSTLALLEVIDDSEASVRLDASNRPIITFIVNTTNKSDTDYTITLCAKYSYNSLASDRKEKFESCFEYDIGAQSTEKFSREIPVSSTREPKKDLKSTGVRITFVNEHQIQSNK